MTTPDFLITSFGGELSPSSTEDENRRKIVRSLQYIYDEYKERRRTRTDTILACWAAYLGTPQATRWQRAHSLRDVGGDMDVDWRHKINRGKAYEIVENIVPYLQGAAFPNEDWFDMVPQEPIDDPDYLMYVKIMKSYMRYKMDECKFKTNWETFLRQLCITGTSVIALPWRVETKTTKRNVKVRSYGREGIQTIEQERIIYNAPECSVEDVIDFYLDPDGLDPNNCNLVRRMVMSRGQIKRLVDEGCYDDMSETEINQMKCYKQGRSDDRVVIEDFLGIQQTASMSDSMEVFEFWGDLELNDREYKDVVCTWCGDRLLRMETNPYWAGKPFIIGTYTQVINSPYGLGALEPVLGDIHEIDVLANIRLDGETVSLMPTWLVNNDGTTDPNEIVVEPGKVIPVADINAIRPLTQDLNFVSVSIQEEQLREQTVDRRTATGSFVGTGPGRSGERVTKAEVEATREAGGNRLSGIYWHIEQTALLPCLTYVYESARQFVVEDTVIPVPGQTADELFYASVGVDQLQYMFRLQPKGATHIANKEFELRQITDWIALVGANPPMAQNINWLEVTKEVTRRFLTHQPERYIQEPQAPDPMAGASPMQQLAEQAGQMGGNEAKQAIQAAVAADGGQNMMQPYLETAPQPVVANNGQQLPI